MLFRSHYDFQLLEKDAERATLMLAAARKDEISRYLGLLGEAGISPTTLGVSTFASFNALFYNQGRGGKRVTALIDLRNGEAEIGVAKGGILRYCRYLTLGSGAPLDALLPEVSGLLAQVEADGGLHKAVRVSLSGAGGGRGDLLHHLAERTGLEVEFLQPLRRIKARGVDPQAASSLGAAIGLAYAVNEAIRERRALAEVAASIDRLQTEATKVEQLKEEVAKLGGQIAALEKIDKEEVRKLDVLRELFILLPKGVTLTLFSVDGREVRIGGSITGSASNLISILEESRVFENVQFTSPVASRGADTQDFQIKAFLEASKNEAEGGEEQGEEEDDES